LGNDKNTTENRNNNKEGRKEEKEKKRRKKKGLDKMVRWSGVEEVPVKGQRRDKVHPKKEAFHC